MPTSTSAVKSKEANISVGCKCAKLKNYNLWISETFQLHNDKNNKSNYSIAPATDIGGLFIPLVKYLRLVGFCPFYIRQDPLTGFVTYEFKWKSSLTAYSICLSASFGILVSYICLYFMWISFSNNFIDVLL